MTSPSPSRRPITGLLRLLAVLLTVLGVVAVSAGAAVGPARVERPIGSGPVASFSITTPACAVAGVPFRLTVTARDAAGRAVPSYRGTISFGQGPHDYSGLPETYTFTAADRGRHAFSVTVFTAGGWAFSTHELGDLSVAGTGRGITVRPGRATQLAVAIPPEPIVAGVTVPIEVIAWDDWGNIATSYRGTVAMSTTDPAQGAGVAPARIRFTRADVGRVALELPDGLTLLTPGDHTVTATDVRRPTLTGSTHVVLPEPRTTGPGLNGWGDNEFGQLGDGTLTDRSTPVVTSTVRTWTDVAAGGQHSLALADDGTLWSWGSTDFGQLGRISEEPGVDPGEVGTSSAWTQIEAGSVSSAGIMDDGTLWLWGSLADSSAPVQVPGTGWVDVALGSDHGVGLRSDGTLWTWGRNDSGQLGTGSPEEYVSVPTQVGGGYWAAIAAGADHTLALRADGSLWAWGRNAFGEVGDGTTTTRSTPVPIAPGTAFAAVAAAGDHSAALTADGGLWTWGRNTQGTLGDGTTTDRLVPQQVATDRTWKTVQLGGASAAAIATDGTLWAWGRDSAGQLGDGTAVDRWAPTQVGTAADWTTVSVGTEFMLGLRS
ncbi:hypothetical protein HP550_14340 [Cellulomonas humilata]|uniref:RCC1-like domain-containing protein n=1 Tax=Cellulomonas humilata TaxID=144055 RepID=A0A7Y6A290_9CELL|nr:hypothetical protein [Cellulomonas humilata]NUU18433.1 hypothetical protein [Cellulomonas humilata]